MICAYLYKVLQRFSSCMGERLNLHNIASHKGRKFGVVSN